MPFYVPAAGSNGYTVGKGLQRWICKRTVVLIRMLESNPLYRPLSVNQLTYEETL